MLHQRELIWEEAVLAVLKDQFGEITRRQVHQTWGDRLVVEATTSRFPKGLVLKASAERSVQVEAQVATCARQAGLPVPEILAEGRDDRLPGRDWFVMRRADGQPWESMPQSDAQRSRTLDDIGRAFVLLHGVKMRGYGPLTADLGGRDPSWASWLRAELRMCSQPLLQAGYLPTDFLSMTDGLLESLGPTLADVPPSLLHGDLGDREIFVDPDSGEVTAIVDWGDALSGDPLYDFARFVAGGPVDDERPARYRPGVKRAYARESGCDPAALETNTSYLYELHNAVRNAFWSVQHEPSWIPGLCTYALSMAGRLR